MNERLKILRDYLGLNQREFSRRINISQPTLALMENGQRLVRDIHVSQICTEFNVNEEWLRHGTGEMFVQTDSISLDDYAKKNGLTDLEIDIIKSYMDLDSGIRKSLMSNLKIIFGKHDEVAATATYDLDNDSPGFYVSESSKLDYIDQEVENYRRELEAEKKAKRSSASEERETS